MPRTLHIPHKTMDELIDNQPGQTATQDNTDKAVVVPPLDEAEENRQSSETQVSEGELEMARNVAKRMGWTPKEAWKGDATRWRDAPEYLEETPRHLEEMRERAKRAAQAAEAAFEDDRRRLLAQAEAGVKAAAEAKDPEAAAAAAKQLAAHSGPSPRVSSWVAERPWYREDPAARAEATKAADLAAAAGYTEAEQLEAADLAVKRRFPEYYGASREEAPRREAPKEEVRLSEIKRPPTVNAPSRTTPTPQNKERGYADLPQDVRRTFEQTLQRKFTNRGDTVEQAQSRYAKSYWREIN